MSTLTKEWLLKTIAELEEERDSVPGAVNEDAAMALAAMKLALASLEAEASGRNLVLAYADSYRDMANQGVESIPVWSVITDLERNIAPLFTAPPAPVSVPAAMEMDDDFDSSFEHGKAVGWNAYRAAMLQSFGNSEQLNSPVIPDGWESCKHLLPIGELIHRLEEQTGEKWIYAKDAIPDGYVMVPVEPTEKMVIEGFESEPDEFFSKSEVWEAYQEMSGCQQAAHRAKLCWSAMLAAAPKPEA